MEAENRYTLKRMNWSIVVAFSCQSCDRPLQINLKDLEGPFTCRGCGKRIVVPSIHCLNESCDGTYVKCNGLIEKLSGEELDKERSAAWEGETLGGRPTDSDHDDYRDIEGSVLSFKCTQCGEKYTARDGHSHGEFRTEKCEQVLCSKCKKIPKSDELPV